ncbi:uncharacterized protein LOC132181699 [Corylus avellana]|uniref:uncharacterized protein LOC132181699 n=1 Tax=Corylus avellana TaxID=13451 RepID=UPI00286BA274|nr:uncharacterized protein LOC132181699 [Corylus avellana]
MGSVAGGSVAGRFCIGGICVGVFLWRACKNILPTKENLRRRGFIDEDRCILCCSEKETVHHILWACPSAQDVWGASSCKLQKCARSYSDFKDFFEELSVQLSGKDLNLLALTLRGIWRRRNLVVHGGDFTHPSIIADTAWEGLLQFTQANEKELNQADEGRGGTGMKWQAPPSGFYKVNWDIAISTGRKCMGIGVIIRDAAGRVLAAQSKSFMAVYDPATGEALAALHAEGLCRDLGFYDIIFEGDSLSMVKAIGERDPNWLRYGHIVEDIKTVLRTLRQWKICHAKREANIAAHGLAKEATMFIMDNIWIEEIPICISNIVHLECNDLSL